MSEDEEPAVGPWSAVGQKVDTRESCDPSPLRLAGVALQEAEGLGLLLKLYYMIVYYTIHYIVDYTLYYHATMIPLNLVCH